MPRKISAHYVFPISSAPIKNGIIELDDNGTILNIIDPGKELKEIAGLEFYSGILVPGFVNTHCHIELSHLKGRFAEHTGLPVFISQISKARVADENIILKAIKKADLEMQNNGIVAVGDISNTEYSFFAKKHSKIKYHTFVEVLSVSPENAMAAFKSCKNLENKFSDIGLSASLAPHAPYSLSKKLFRLFNEETKKNKKTVSMHNQETASENELFINKSGDIFDSIKNMIGVDFSHFKPTGQNSLESVSHSFPKENKCLLVHNTFSKENDIVTANGCFNKLYWVFCPNANLYIENKLPDIPLFYKLKQKCTIGTDSLASNHKLSVLDELKTIHAHFPELPMWELLKWASLNGAEALQLSDKMGSFEIGKQPGVNLISNIDFNKMLLIPESKVKVLVDRT
ncbi:MAG: hypothetical protein B6I20_07430 [Bacteroidetes bacterium 4572_117]|nr:MAG: hypothetical protein B6I20_07430 [Bacteroidetes bacterium 4572_117]